MSKEKRKTHWRGKRFLEPVTEYNTILKDGARVDTEVCTNGTREIILKRYFSAEGEPIPAPPAPPWDVAEWLENLKTVLSMPLPSAYVDSYYTEKELIARGVRDWKTFLKHQEETRNEIRYEASLIGEDGQTEWTEKSTDRAALESEMKRRAKFLPQCRRVGPHPIPRECYAQAHPAETSRIEALAMVFEALDLLEADRDDNNAAQALWLGVELEAARRDIEDTIRAPEILRAPHRYNKPKGEQKHPAVTEKKRHLREEAKRIILEREHCGNPIRPRELVEKLKKHAPEHVTEGRIQHRRDSDGYSISYFKDPLFGDLREELGLPRTLNAPKGVFP